jgi:spermidine/putrescine transport system permease protein
MTPMTDRSKQTPLLALLPTWLVLGVFFIAPLLIMLVISFARRGTYGGVAPIDDLKAYLHSGLLLHNYREAAEPLYVGIFWKSLWMAVVTTILCLVISYPVAYYIAIAGKPSRKNLMLALVAVPFWTSFLIRTYAWVLILRTEGLLNTALMHLHLVHEPLQLLPSNFAILLGLVYGELPFMILPLYASLEKLDRSLLEAGSDLGASGWGTFWRVTVPLTMPGIIAGTILVFIPSIGQFVVTDVLGGGKVELIGNVINDQFHGEARNPPFGSALAFGLTAIVLLMLMAYALYAKRGRQEVAL